MQYFTDKQTGKAYKLIYKEATVFNESESHLVKNAVVLAPWNSDEFDLAIISKETLEEQYTPMG